MKKHRLIEKRLKKQRSALRRGFTLIEVMIVILIVLALGGLVAYNLLGAKEKAVAQLGEVDMNTLKGALKQFRFEHGRYPTDEEGIAVLWDKNATADEDVAGKWTKLLEAPMAEDRWGTPWGYRQQSEYTEETMYDLWSFGPDKQEGTEDDIVSWDKDAAEGGGMSPPVTPPTGG